MDLTIYLDEIVTACVDALADGTFADGQPAPAPEYHVKEMEYELASVDNVEKTALKVRSRPYALVSLGDPEAIDQDDTLRTTDETISLEVVVAVSELRNELLQKRRARAYCMDVRNRLQGRSFQGIDKVSTVVVAFESMQHIATTTGLTLYSTIFRVYCKKTL
jgi:hypothetical protein